MSGQGKEKLLDYVSHIQDKIRGIEESGEPLEEAQTQKVVASVVNSVRSLCACAPGEVRSKIKDALAAAGCLDGTSANPAAGLGELSAGLAAVVQVLEGHGAPADDGGHSHSAGDAVAAEPPVACPEPGDETETLVGVVKVLWQLEEHFRMKPGTDIHLNIQRRGAAGSAGSGVVPDHAREPLFSEVDTSKFNKLDKAFLALLDNYIRDSSKREHVDNVEREEMDRFMELLAGSPHMQYVHKVLVKWDLAPAKFGTFMARVYDAWFTNYYGSSSSGFEHVFVGEEKYNKETSAYEVIGLHNWIQFYREEKKGCINYLGYAHKGPEDGCMISVTFAFKDDNAVKPVSTFLVGTTIAFDFALATLVFFGGKDGDHPWVSIGGHDCAIQLYKTTNRLGTYVRSVYID